jgi:acetyl-CoA synthetase
MVIGVRNDPQFGPLVMIGLGGILVEALQDTALAPAPIAPAQAEALVNQLKGVKLLQGFRGMPAVDLPGLAKVISDVSRFAADHRDTITELDINPLICTGTTITAVDALMVVA